MNERIINLMMAAVKAADNTHLKPVGATLRVNLLGLPASVAVFATPFDSNVGIDALYALQAEMLEIAGVKQVMTIIVPGMGFGAAGGFEADEADSFEADDAFDEEGMGDGFSM